MTRVSVIIPTFNRPGPLSECLRSLANSFPRDAETIVVSDGSTVALEDTVEPFREKLRLKFVPVPHGGPAAARNRGLSRARGDIVAFIDDDCRPAPGWIEALASGVSISPPIAAGGTTRNGLADNCYAEASQLILKLVGRYDCVTRGQIQFFPSNNMAFPADALSAMGGFDESFRSAEDRELCRRWQQNGHEMRAVAKAIVDHDSRLDLLGFVRQFFLYGRGAAQFHTSGGRWSLLDSIGFHLRLPLLVPGELPRRGTAKLIGLLFLWEVVNLCGFTFDLCSRRSPGASFGDALLNRRAR